MTAPKKPTLTPKEEEGLAKAAQAGVRAPEELREIATERKSDPELEALLKLNGGTKKPIETGPTGAGVAQRIREARKDMGWRLEDLSSAMDSCGRPLSAAMLGLMENSGRRVDVDDLSALASALGTTTSFLLGIKEPQETDLESLRTDLAILDETIGQLIDEVNNRIDGLSAPNRLEALKGAVALHSAINYRAHGTDIDAAVTSTADTLLKWLEQ